MKSCLPLVPNKFKVAPYWPVLISSWRKVCKLQKRFLTLSQDPTKLICRCVPWARGLWKRSPRASWSRPGRPTSRGTEWTQSGTPEHKYFSRLYSYKVHIFSSVVHKFHVTVSKCCIGLHKHYGLWMLYDENNVMHINIFVPWILQREFLSSLNLWWY